MTRLSISGFLSYFLVAWLSPSAFVLRPAQPSRRKLGRSRLFLSQIDPNNKIGRSAPAGVELILIDHYDSFTYNLVDMLTQLCGKPPAVFPSDCADTWDEFLRRYKIRHYDGIVLSPGPGHPRDCSLGLDSVLRNPNVPIFGVCLGHQIIGMAYNATVATSPQPIHGQVHGIEMLGVHERDTTLFEGIDEISATRYHSLQVILRDNSVLKPTAKARNDNVLMALRHADRPHWGVQFHPESIGTSHGMEILGNFVAECSFYRYKHGMASSLFPNASYEPQTSYSLLPKTSATTIWVHKVPNLPLNGANMKPESLMDEILASERFTYWLDHSDSTRLPGTSILGSARRRVEYYGKEKSETYLKVIDEAGVETQSKESILSFLERHMPHTVKVLEMEVGGESPSTSESDATKYPFSFFGGFIGYLGYEVRLDLTKTKNDARPLTRSDDENVPTAAFFMADRSFVYCHENCQWYLVGTCQDDKGDIEKWMISMSRRLQLGAGYGIADKEKPRTHTKSVPMFRPKRSPEVYAHNFDRCLQHIRQGDSYELCLTNQLETLVDARLNPLELHRILRTKNPTQHSAFMSWGGRFAICSSSPERFLSVQLASGSLVVEAKPIKGTMARVVPKQGAVHTEQEKLLDRHRAATLQGSVKEMAENLMIVDLLRNDLSRVCQPGSVHVSKLMDIESYATVHQLVSTIRGSLGGSKNSSVDVLRACFPGGSMTGAPKVRSMEILNELEEGAARGVYSGCMGYLSLNGAMDMNILIRTAVLSNHGENWKVCIGAGGAITALSDLKCEFDEMMLKADVVVKSVEEWARGSSEQIVDTAVYKFNSTDIC